ncbi:MAG: alpha/beta hydrolase [Ferruginibacter sp.]|nr:alpha/beta hydrolase [Ferruginibacter sp.]
MPTSNSIVLIHGNFVNDLTWAKWKSRYEQKGYTVYTPTNPGHAGNPAELRKKVHPDLTKTGFIDVVNNIAELIDSLPGKPLVIGHSMAGMATLKLLEMGKAAAAVSIDGAPPKNVFPPFTTLKAVLPAFGFLSFKPYFMGSRSWYDHCFFNTLPAGDRAAAFDAFAVPESYKVSRELVLNPFSNIDFKQAHAPVLFIGGGKDNIFPQDLTATIAKKYSDPTSRVDLKVFEDRSHFICGEPGWEEVADYILDWYEKL